MRFGGPQTPRQFASWKITLYWMYRWGKNRVPKTQKSKLSRGQAPQLCVQTLAQRPQICITLQREPTHNNKWTSNPEQLAASLICQPESRTLTLSSLHWDKFHHQTQIIEPVMICMISPITSLCGFVFKINKHSCTLVQPIFHNWKRWRLFQFW